MGFLPWYQHSYDYLSIYLLPVEQEKPIFYQQHLPLPNNIYSQSLLLRIVSWLHSQSLVTGQQSVDYLVNLRTWELATCTPSALHHKTVRHKATHAVKISHLHHSFPTDGNLPQSSIFLMAIIETTFSLTC